MKLFTKHDSGYLTFGHRIEKKGFSNFKEQMFYFRENILHQHTKQAM